VRLLDPGEAQVTVQPEYAYGPVEFDRCATPAEEVDANEAD